MIPDYYHTFQFLQNHTPACIVASLVSWCLTSIYSDASLNRALWQQQYAIVGYDSSRGVHAIT